MEHLKLSLLISSFIIPFILSATLFSGFSKSLPRKVMAIALFNAFLVFLFNYFYFQKIFEIYSFIHSLHIATVLWIFPSVFLYVKSLVLDEKRFRKEFSHLLPGLLFGLISAILFYGLLNSEQRIFYLTNYRSDVHFADWKLKAVSLFRLTDVALIVLQVIYYSISMIRIPHQYEEQLKNEFSNIDHFSIRWVWWFIVSFVVVGLLCISFYLFNPFHEANEIFLIFFLFSISAFIWIIGLWSFKQEQPPPKWMEEARETDITPKDEAPKNNELAQKLLSYFETEKPYLQADLNLSFICKQIGTNRTYLSSVINSNFGMNFNAFVNQYRVNYAIELLQKNATISQEELAHEAGFGSLSSLKRAMRNQKENKLTGQHPVVPK